MWRHHMPHICYHAPRQHHQRYAANDHARPVGHDRRATDDEADAQHGQQGGDEVRHLLPPVDTRRANTCELVSWCLMGCRAQQLLAFPVARARCRVLAGNGDVLPSRGLIAGGGADGAAADSNGSFWWCWCRCWCWWIGGGMVDLCT